MHCYFKIILVTGLLASARRRQIDGLAYMENVGIPGGGGISVPFFFFLPSPTVSTSY